MSGYDCQTIVCLGAGPAFKGGMANYNTSLAKALDAMEGTDVHIVSWTQQYPAIIPREFRDLKSKTDHLEGSDVKVHYLLNYNNPLSWQRTVDFILRLKPQKVIIQWSIAVQGLPLGYILRKLSHHDDIETIVDLHFVVQKENSRLDRMLTKRGLRYAKTFIVHAMQTFRELKALFPKKEFYLSEDGKRSRDQATVLKLFHPIYDLYRPDPAFDAEAFKQSIGLRKHVFLFFGFIRKYKGLHHCIRAFAELAKQRDDVSLLICGESFWHTLDNKKFSTRLKTVLFGAAKSLFLQKSDDERDYRPLELIDELGIRDRVVVFNEFVPNEDVHKYFQVADSVLLFYLTATPSGIESLSYNFNLPILATRVGHFPETVKDGFNGYLADPDDIRSMAEVMQKAISEPIPRTNVGSTTKQLSWSAYASAILHIVP
jgi:glycosyltransferase involved in cell wall biosynthesis